MTAVTITSDTNFQDLVGAAGSLNGPFWVEIPEIGA